MVDAAKPPLGLGRLVSGTFGLFFRRFLLFMVIGLVPSLIMNAASFLFLGDIFRAQAIGEVVDPALMFGPAYWIYLVFSMLLVFVMMGVYTLAAYDASLGKSVAVGAYVGRTIASLPAIIVLGILFYIMMAIGLALLVLPGLYLMARYFVFTPAILVERAGFGALRRAAALSQDYRWPIVAGILLLGIIVIGVSLVANLTLVLAVSGLGGLTAYVLVQSVLGAVMYSLTAIFTALLYARLREIKEGVGMVDLVDVFA